MSKQILILMMVYSLVVSLFVIEPCEAAAGRKLSVVTTTTDLASIAAEIGKDHIDVKSVCRGREDPHFIQAKPSFITLARRADLWIRVGLELEIGYEEPIIDGSRNNKIRIGNPGHLDASAGIIRLEVPATQKIDRSMGDVHPLGNPHYWLDPYNGRVVAINICNRLKRLDPVNSEDYETNCSIFLKKLDSAMFGVELVKAVGADELWKYALEGTLQTFLEKKNLRSGGWVGKMSALRGVKIATYHRSWSYFANRFGIVVAIELEPKPGIPPSPAHLAAVIDHMKAGNVKAILLEPFYSRKSADLVGSKTGAKVVVCANAVGGQKDVTDYTALIDLVVSRLSDVLSDQER